MAQSKLTTTALVALASATTLGTAVLATTVSRQHATLDALSAQTSALRSTRDIAPQLREAETALAETTRQLRATEAKIAALPPRPSSSEPPSAGMISGAKTDLLLANNPEYVRLRRQSIRESIITSYGDFFAELNLSPAKLEALKELLVSDWVEADLERAKAIIAGQRSASEEVKVARQTSTDDALRALLGESGRAAVRHAQAVGPPEPNLSADFAEGGHSLSRTQERRLASLIYDHIRAPAEANRASPIQAAIVLPSGLTEAETRVLAQLGNDFSAAQRELLVDYFKFEREQTAFQQRIANQAP